MKWVKWGRKSNLKKYNTNRGEPTYTVNQTNIRDDFGKGKWSENVVANKDIHIWKRERPLSGGTTRTINFLFGEFNLNRFILLEII